MRISDGPPTRPRCFGPLIQELGWSDEDWDALAAGTLAEHLLRCGAPVTGSYGDRHIFCRPRFQGRPGSCAYWLSNRLHFQRRRSLDHQGRQYGRVHDTGCCQGTDTLRSGARGRSRQKTPKTTVSFDGGCTTSRTGAAATRKTTSTSASSPIKKPLIPRRWAGNRKESPYTLRMQGSERGHMQ